jgi:hypothetical protein
MPVIGFLAPLSIDEEQLRGFRQGLKQAGFVEGENVSVLYRSAAHGRKWPKAENRRVATFRPVIEVLRTRYGSL